LLQNADNSIVPLYNYNSPYDVWRESIYGVHIPHLVHYDDRNGMACSIEGRSPFLDHRIAEYVATIRPSDFLMHGHRKYILRESCKQYLPDIIYNRTDKIGFFTPLADALKRDAEWAASIMKRAGLFKEPHVNYLLGQLASGGLSTPDALHIWRCISAYIWMQEFNVPV
jgi:asparagine synthase (glutamine-hydrolysing)